MTLLARIEAVLHRARVAGGWDDQFVAADILRAIREPDEEAVVIAAGVDFKPRRDDVRASWRSLIDQALAEAAEPAHTSSEIGHG